MATVYRTVRVEDLDTTEDGRPFIVMEYLEGRNLREVIRQEGALAVPRAVGIVRQVASALAAAHALGITHRDIKPDNILLARGPDDAEVAKVLDFGIAKVKEGAFDTGTGYAPTGTGMMVGTPQYISPEQAMGKRGDQVDGRSDIWCPRSRACRRSSCASRWRSAIPRGGRRNPGRTRLRRTRWSSSDRGRGEAAEGRPSELGHHLQGRDRHRPHEPPGPGGSGSGQPRARA